MSSILSPFLGILVALIKYIKENKDNQLFYLYLINVGPYDVYLYNLTNSFQIALYISNFILFYILYKFQNDLIKNIVSFKYINFLFIPFIIYLTFGGITNIYDIIPE